MAFVTGLALLLAQEASGFYLSAAINRRLEALIPPAPSPFALTQSFKTEAFCPQTRPEGTGVAQRTVELHLDSIAATKDAIADAMSRGLLVRVLGTRVVAFGSQTAVLNFVGAISSTTARASVKWDSQPAPLLPSVDWDSQPAPVLL